MMARRRKLNKQQHLSPPWLTLKGSATYPQSKGSATSLGPSHCLVPLWMQEDIADEDLPFGLCQIYQQGEGDPGGKETQSGPESRIAVDQCNDCQPQLPESSNGFSKS